MPEPQVVYEDEGLEIAVWSRVFINRWRSVATQERLKVLVKHQLALVDATADRRIAVITTLMDKSGLMPNAAARKEAEVVAKAVREFVIVQAQIVEGEGFVAASIRAILTGVMLAIRAPYPNKVFKTVEEALPWVEEKLHAAGYTDEASGVSGAVLGMSRRD